MAHRERQADRDESPQGVWPALEQRPYATGEPCTGFAIPVVLERQADGPREQLYVDYVYQPILDAEGHITGILVEGSEVTEREAANEALRTADRRKDEFLAMLAHELRITRGSEPLHVDGDLTRLTQCIVNILTNAARYTAPGGRIRISLARSGEEGVVEITDNGPGISPEMLPNIFDLFVQADRTLERSQGGLDIGLSVVRKLLPWPRTRGPPGACWWWMTTSMPPTRWRRCCRWKATPWKPCMAPSRRWSG
jgi:signal transduction histidine kinase